uniref:Uncharacterized protein TCIL3000_11_6700 n=1 Tax=Trypanosoma congolense (strain IL3000) TaxID=1068625 RepID=G0V0S3_TRYCI|nr:unnamed protein product [Trypanosoma congolense IL3000]
MRLKATPLTCVFAWAPESLGTPTLLAAASVSGTIDENFSGEVFLEIRLVDVTQTDETEIPVVGRTLIPSHALRVDWSPHGGPQGIIAVGCEDGKVYVFDAGIIMRNFKCNPNADTEKPLLCTIAEHRGAVRGCQFNPSQPTFLGIGADDGAWDVWLLENPRDPQRVPIMPDSAQAAAIVHLQWNPKWPHILATAVASGVVNVWNLKTQTLAVSLHVSKGGKSGVSGNVIAWHPTIATQIAVGLNEMHPVIQLWDLKKTVVPLREMSAHGNAVTGLAWNPTDHAMLASCDADGKILWWDPSTGNQGGELQRQDGYVVDMKWSNASPIVLATSSFEPLFCISTAEDFSSAPVAGAPVQKSLQRPCGASINMAGVIASISPNSSTAVSLTRVSRGYKNASSGYDENSAVDLFRLPSNPTERVEWLKAHQYDLLAAAAACKSDRTPILTYLSEEVAATEEAEDPFETMQASQKSLEDVAAAHIAAGRISEAVEACLEECRFDDAFAIAYLQGGKLVQRVQQEYAQYSLRKSEGKRHILYASAIASGDFSCLTAGVNTSWKEALSVIISFVGEGFSEACDKLAFGLKEAGNRDSAITCFICSGNVDAVAELWREDEMPVEKLVREVSLLEEVTGRRVTSPFYAEYLYEHGMNLLGNGSIEKAMSFFERSAGIGCHNAAIMMDRMRFEVPCGQIAFPYVMAPLSDTPSPSWLGFAASRENKQQLQQQFQHQQHGSISGQQQPLQTQPTMYAPQPQPQRPQAQVQPMAPPTPSAGPPTHQPGPTATATAAAPGARLVPNQISSWSSMNQVGQPAMSGPPAPAIPMGGYNSGPTQFPHAQQVQNSIPAARAPSTQNHVDPQQSMQTVPPPSRGSSMPSTQSPFGPPPGHTAQSALPPPPGTLTGPPQPIRGSATQPPPVPPGKLMHPKGYPNTFDNNYTPYGAPQVRNTPPPTKSVPPIPPQEPMASPSTNMMGTPCRPMGGAAGTLSGIAPTGAPGWGASPQCTQAPGPQATPGSLAPPPPAPSATSAFSAPPSTAVQAARPHLPVQGAGVGYPPVMGSRGAPRNLAAAGAVGDDFGLAQFDILSLNPAHHAVAQTLRSAVQQMNNAQRRSAVAKAAVELFKMLQMGSLPQEVIDILSEYVKTLGTPASKSWWRQLSDKHFDVIQPIINLKFL